MTDLTSTDLRIEHAPLLCEALLRDGFFVVEDLIPHALLAALGSECDALLEAGRFQSAGTGRAAGHRVDAQRRGDSILWMEAGGREAPQTRFLAAMDALRVAINQRLLLGLHELEAHYAVYPPGAGYARHRDRFRDDDARVLSLVVYLNPDWGADDGGELRLHLHETHLDVLPREGTVVLFLSDEIEHEVRPSRCTRRSIAGWFRRRMPGSSV